MAKMPTDANAKPIQVLRPYASADVTGASAPCVSTVVRLTADAVATYNVTGATGFVTLPAGIVEYIRVTKGDIITTTAQVNITQMG